MEEADKDWMRIGTVSAQMFLLVAAHPDSPGKTVVKRLLYLLAVEGMLHALHWLSMPVARLHNYINTSSCFRYVD